ncbi:MAG: hypothetical protein EOO73_12520 [Myxococcales bacterium]|nr:MAG: hypothetical protein EOO73_12520 [Myxococcales bacterium]
MGALRTPVPKAPSRPDVEVDEGALELSEVPATVVCATCGLPECDCEADRPSSFSGVVAIVPWERPGGSLLSRLWSTAKLCTLSPQTFFASLPPGAVAAPLGFAMLAELLAALGLCATFGAAVLAVVPGLAAELSANADLRSALARALGYGVPALVVGMVVLHAGHGVALDRAARQEGSLRGGGGRGLRFGLYSCGWDLVTLPLGLLLLTLTDGLLSAVRHSARGLTAPSAAANAYLENVHGLEPSAVHRASRRAVRLVFAPTLALIVAGFAIGLWWAAS